MAIFRRDEFPEGAHRCGNGKLQGGERHHKYGAAFGGVECGYRTVEALNNLLHNGQSKASASAVACTRGIAALEALEQEGRVIFDAAAIVFYSNYRLVVYAGKQDADMATFFNVTNGIIDQIDDGLFEAIGVA